MISANLLIWRTASILPLDTFRYERLLETLNDISKGKLKMSAFCPLLGFSGELHHDQHSYVILVLVCAEYQPASHPFLGGTLERFRLPSLNNIGSANVWNSLTVVPVQSWTKKNECFLLKY